MKLKPLLIRVARRRGPSEQEWARWRPVIDGAPDRIPDLGNPLPFVQQHWPGSLKDSSWLRLSDCALRWLVKPDYGRSATLSCRGLADAFRALQRDGLERSENFVKFGV
jgi:hypothetical protein